jgi:hypothetical protein
MLSTQIPGLPLSFFRRNYSHAQGQDLQAQGHAETPLPAITIVHLPQIPRSHNSTPLKVAHVYVFSPWSLRLSPCALDPNRKLPNKRDVRTRDVSICGESPTDQQATVNSFQRLEEASEQEMSFTVLFL